MASAPSTEAAPISLPAGDWHVVPAQSKLGFLTHIVFGRIPVRGRFSGYEGDLHIDNAGHASGALHIEAATLTTGIKKRDTHLRSSDFFAVDEHPKVRFDLAALAPNSDGRLTLTGTLHIRTEALPVETSVSVVNTGPDKARLDADFKVDHRASGLDWKKIPETVRVQASLALERAS